MASDLPISPRYIIGVIGLLIVAGLMVTNTVGSEAGVTLLVGILAALGLFEGRARGQK